MGCFPLHRLSRSAVLGAAELQEPVVDAELLGLLDQDGGHQLLGLDDEGLLEVCKMLEYPVFGTYHNDYEEDGYRPKYKRGAHPEMEWVAKAHPHALVGYDLCCRVKEYLKETGNEHESICTLLLKRGSKHVGRANVFYSHVQAVPVRRTLEYMRKGMEAHKAELPASTTKVFYWLDYTTLKQCQSDFLIRV